MKTIYRVNTSGYRMVSRSISAGEETPNEWYDSPEIAEVEFKKLQENRRNEYKELLPQATEILEQKKQELIQFIDNLGCDVFTSAERPQDMEINSWITLEISLDGKIGSYVYSTDIQT